MYRMLAFLHENLYVTLETERQITVLLQQRPVINYVSSTGISESSVGGVGGACTLVCTATCCAASIAFMAKAVVSPRLPALMPEDPKRHSHPTSHPPSLHCICMSLLISTSLETPSCWQATTRIANSIASPASPIRSSKCRVTSGLSRACSCSSVDFLKRRLAKYRKASGDG